MKYRTGVDVGGTFTDLVSIDGEGQLKISKTSSTPEDSSNGVINAVKKADIDLRDVSFFVHGATVGANTIIENKGARTAIITTRGFRDNLELRRGQRVINRATDMYNLQMDLPQDYVGGYNPLVPRKYRYEISERLNYKGEVITPLNEAEVRRVARELKKENIEAVAVCYLFSFLNPDHEQRTAAILRELMPQLRISLSSEVLPVIREYERLSTTMLNSYIMPKMQSYIKNLRDKLSYHGMSQQYYIMQSSGGIMASGVAEERPVYTIDSGPAGGVSAACELGKMLGYADVIAFDMGGTTAKVCVIRDNRPSITTEYWVDGKYFSGAPIIDMVEIGAGGGSVCWIDAANSVHIGPRSAGANPGPVCYGKGGVEPTITDAILTLGYLNPHYFLGGDMKVDIKAAREAIKNKIADKLKISLDEAALGIYKLAAANMLAAMRIATVQRGYDPRNFSMVVFGGTGAVFAVRMAQELRIPRVIVPLAPGCFSALGLITSDATYSVYRSYVVRTSKADLAKMQDIFRKIENEAVSKIKELEYRKKEIQLKYYIAMRYEGQAHEVSIEIPAETIRRKLDVQAIARFEKMFHEKHKALYGHSSRDMHCEFFTLSVTAIGPIPKTEAACLARGTQDPSEAFKGRRRVFWEEYRQYKDTAIYERSKLKAGNIIIGPAIIEQMDTTTVIPPGQRASIEKHGNIIIEISI